MNPVKDFGESAKSLAGNPLGIIALFIVLVYGFAAGVLGISAQLEAGDRRILVWFLVAFPVLVLSSFTWLVGWRYVNLYAPKDYSTPDGFVSALKARQETKAGYHAGAATATAVITPHLETALTALEQIQSHPNSDASALAHVSDALHRALTEATSGVSDEEAEMVATATDEVSRAQMASSRRGNFRLLWVDDRPDNNIYERRSMEALGINFHLAASTAEALGKLRAQKYDAVISDMGRPEGPRAGYDLLDAMRNRRDQTPFIIYAGSRDPKHNEEAVQHGAVGTTNRPDELLSLVSQALNMTLSH